MSAPSPARAQAISGFPAPADDSALGRLDGLDGLFVRDTLAHHHTLPFYLGVLVSSTPSIAKAAQTLPDEEHEIHEEREQLLDLCQRMAERVELITLCGATGALVDPGRCSLAEAQLARAGLLARLRRHWARAEAVIGLTPTHAELTALIAWEHWGDRDDWDDWEDDDLARLPANVAAIPIRLLARLDPTRALPQAVVERLAGYGLRTLGHVTRLDARNPQALRRQFGPAIGARVAALCRGENLIPLRPAHLLPLLTVRRTFPEAISLDAALAALDSMAMKLAHQVTAHEKQGCELRLRVAWESGAVTRARRRLARPLHQPDELALAARSLVATLLPPSQHTGRETATLSLAAIAVTLTDLSTRLPAQPAPLFAHPRAQAHLRDGTTTWPERAARLARIATEVGEPLTRRYRAPALYCLETVCSDAILPEERFRLVRLGAPTCQRSAPALTAPDATPRSSRSSPAANGSVHGSQETAGAMPPEPHWW